MALAYITSPDKGQVTFRLYTDNGGSPDQLLESLDATTPYPFIPSYPTINVPSLAHSSLSAGQTYWLFETPTTADTYALWNLNDQNIYGPVFNTLDGYYNQRLPAFRVTVGATAVPEPGPVAFGILAAGSVLELVARKRKA